MKRMSFDDWPRREPWKVRYIILPATVEILLYDADRNPNGPEGDDNPGAPPAVAEWFREVMRRDK